MIGSPEKRKTKKTEIVKVENLKKKKKTIRTTSIPTRRCMIGSPEKTKKLKTEKFKV